VENVKEAGERGEEKRKGMHPKCRGCRTRDRRRRSLLRRDRAPEGRARASKERAQAPDGRRRRETGGEVRSGKNAIFGAAWREERRWVPTPKRKEVNPQILLE